jgi:hypothetical protein
MKNGKVILTYELTFVAQGVNETDMVLNVAEDIAETVSALNAYAAAERIGARVEVDGE